MTPMSQVVCIDLNCLNVCSLQLLYMVTHVERSAIAYLCQNIS